MLYRFLVDNANQIHSLLSNADAEADVSSERARNYRITAAFLACDTFNRLLYESDFQKSLEECRFWYRDYYDSNMKALDPYDADNLDMLYIFLKAERRLLMVAGMNEGAASYLLDDDNVIPILSNASLDREQGPLARERVENALSVRREETCNFAKILQDERKKVEEQKQEEAKAEVKKKFTRRIFNGIGGAALVTLNPAIGAGLFVSTGGFGAVASAPLIALSGALGGALINEAVQQPL
jgi:hypothetical protein